MGESPTTTLQPKIKKTPRPSSWRGRQKERTAVDWWRQLEQRCELRSRLCELEQRLVECECEHLGSNYFYGFGNGIETTNKDTSTASWESVRLSRASAAGA
nr:MAG TPA: hypothetical protein [Caudoviricetes sp.]